MRLIDKQDDILPFFRLFFNLVQDTLDTLFVFSFVFSSGHQAAEVERKETTDERGGNVSVDDSLSESFDNGCFAW
jgi:hypothetical protein